MSIILGPGLNNVPVFNVINQAVTLSSDIFVNAFFKGVELITSVTNAPVSPHSSTLKPSILGVDPVSNKSYMIFQGPPITLASGVATAVTLYPSIPEVANAKFANLLPFQFRVIMLHLGTDPFDYTVSMNTRP